MSASLHVGSRLEIRPFTYEVVGAMKVRQRYTYLLKPVVEGQKVGKTVSLGRQQFLEGQRDGTIKVLS